MAAAHRAYEAGELGTARELLGDALAASPHEPGLRLWLGRVLNDLEQGERALEVLGPALEAAPRSGWLLVERGRAESLTGGPEAAASSFRLALEVYPSLGTARIHLADLLIANGEAEEALRTLAPLPEAPEAGVVVLRARAMEAAGRVEEAETSLRARLDPSGDASSDLGIRLALCRMLANLGEEAKAWEVALPLLTEELGVVDRILVAQVARRAGHPLEALALLGSVLLEDPTRASALAELGEVVEHAGDLEVRLGERRVAARPDDVDGWRELLEADLRRGDAAQALERTAEIPATVLALPAIERLRGEALRRSGRNEEARALLAPLCAAGDARACYEIGMLEHSTGRLEPASEAFASGAAGPWAADAHYNRAVCLDGLGRWAEAVAAYRDALALRPAFPEAWLQLGNDLRWRLGDGDGARRAYGRYLELGGDDAEIRRFLESR